MKRKSDSRPWIYFICSQADTSGAERSRERSRITSDREPEIRRDRDSQLQRADAEDLGETAGSHEDLRCGRPLGTRTRGILNTSKSVATGMWKPPDS